MRDFYELAPHVMPWAPTCPEPLMIQYLREAAIEFCRRTRSWRTEEIYKLTAPEQDIQLVTCCDSIVHEIERVRYREDSASIWQPPLKPITFEEADDWQGGEATPVYFTQRIANTLRVVPFTTGEIKVTMFLKPDQQAQTIPDYIAEQYPQVIAAGALAKLLMLPGYDFAEPNQAMMYQAMFDEACDRHFRDNTRGQQRARTRTTPRFL